MTDPETKRPNTNSYELYERQSEANTSQLEQLRASVRRHDYFADDATDEFKVVRADGRSQGIFKVWSPNVIPLLEGAHSVDEQVEWANKQRNYPLSAYECLESWRAFSEVNDRRLQQVFANREVPNDPKEAVAELFMRLDLSFAYAAPFYNIEALVADSRDDQSNNPIDNNEDVLAGGALDVVALLLPSALSAHVTAERGDWNGTNWTTISEAVQTMRHDFMNDDQTEAAEQYRLVMKVADLAGADPEDIVFSANALQFIPTDVGGRRDDMPSDLATTQLMSLLDASQKQMTTSLVGKDINALIRFRNWSPAVRSEENFEGKLWHYDAVCAAAGELLKTIDEHKDTLLKPEACEEFADTIMPQLNGLDATSAKGRVLLGLLTEESFTPEAEASIHASISSATQEVLNDLHELTLREDVVDMFDATPTYLVGGKAYGLRTAATLFGSERVHGGFVVTSEAINRWLRSDSEISDAIDALKQSSDVNEQLRLGEYITRLIQQSDVPQSIVEGLQARFAVGSKVALRSSSFDEDVSVIGPAPGVYESAIDCPVDDQYMVENGIKMVVGSFFSDKAISHRNAMGLRHEPLMGVAVQEFLRGNGGTIFIDKDGIQLNIASAPHSVNEYGKGGIEAFDIGADYQLPNSDYATRQQITQIVWMAQKSYEIYGPGDIEFIVEPETGEVKILQMRALLRPEQSSDEHEEFQGELQDVVIDNLDAIPNFGAIEGKVNLVIDESINLEAFQGFLFRSIAIDNAQGKKIRAVTTHQKLPRTCHFVNIVNQLGITVYYAGDDK